MACRIRDLSTLTDLERTKQELKDARRNAGEKSRKVRLAQQKIVYARTKGHRLSQKEIEQYQIIKGNPVLEAAVEDSMIKQQYQSLDKVVDKISRDMNLLVLHDNTMKPQNFPEYLASSILAWNAGPARILRETGSKTANWVSMRIFGHPEGRGGQMRAIETAAEVMDMQVNNIHALFQPRYRELMWEHAERHSKNPWDQWSLAEKNAEIHPELERIHKAAYADLNNLRMGKPRSTEKVVTDLANLIVETNEKIYEELLHNGVTTGKLEKSYAEMKFDKVKLGKFEKSLGRDKLSDLFTQGYENAGFSRKAARLLTEKLWEDMERIDDYGSYRNTFKSKNDLLRKMDTGTEMYGIKIEDLLNTNLRDTIDVQARNAAGWIGLAKATQGAIKNDYDINSLKSLLEEEITGQGKDPAKVLQLMDDYLNRLFGRPVRGGIPREIRSMMNLATLTGMGKTGVSQLVETGQGSIRTIFNAHDMNFVKKVKMLAGSDKSEHVLVQELHNMLGLTNGLAELFDHSRFIDESKMGELSKIRQTSIKLADWATGGHTKAVLLRGLGKFNFQDVIQKWQSRAIMSSYLMDVANHFKYGTGKMSVKRMSETGICDHLGKDIDLEYAFKNHAEYDSNGLLEKLNFDKWSQEAKDKITYGVFKAESHEIQRVLVSDLPTWVNPVFWQIATQFKNFSIVATNKQLLRQVRFADAESVVSLAINTAMAGMVKAAQFKVAAVGMNALQGRDLLGKIEDKQDKIERDVYRYNSMMGMLPDVYDLSEAMYKVGGEAWNGHTGAAAEGGWKYLTQTPVVGLMNKYVNASGIRSDVSNTKQWHAVRELIPLQNTYLFGAMANFIEDRKRSW